MSSRRVLQPHQEQPPSGCTTLPCPSAHTWLEGVLLRQLRAGCGPPAWFWGPLAIPAMSFADSHGKMAWSPPLPRHISEGYFLHEEKPGGPGPDHAPPAGPAQMQHAELASAVHMQTAACYQDEQQPGKVSQPLHLNERQQEKIGLLKVLGFWALTSFRNILDLTSAKTM